MEIGDRAFQYCKRLETVNVGNGNTEIGKTVFFGCAENLIITIAGENHTAKILFQNIGATAVAKERPKIFKDGCLTGVGIGVGICSIIYGGYNYCKNKMNEKKALNAEPKLREELTKTIENTSTKAEIDEKPHQN